MGILIFALPAAAELQTVQPSVSPTPSATKTRVGNQSLAVQVCNSLVKLNERARSINRSFGEYFKLDGEMNEVYLKSQAHLTQATKEQFPKRKTNLGAGNKTSTGQIGGVVTKEQVIGQSPEVRRMRELQGNILLLKDKILRELRVLQQEMSSVASDIARLSDGGLVPAESKQCIQRASSQLDGEISGLNKNISSPKVRKGAQNLNTQLSICGSCDENQCVDCCRNLYKISAEKGSALRAEQERHQRMCIAHCLVINSSCKKDSETEDMWSKATNLLKSVIEHQRDNIRNITNI